MIQTPRMKRSFFVFCAVLATRTENPWRSGCSARIAKKWAHQASLAHSKAASVTVIKLKISVSIPLIF